MTPTKQLSSDPIALAVSPEELSKGALSLKNLELALRGLHNDGMIILEDVVDHKKLDFLNEKMLADSRELQSRGLHTLNNYDKGTVEQGPPLTKKYFDSSIYLNPLAAQVTSHFLGPAPKITLISGNTAYPPITNSPYQEQPIHSDSNFDHPNIPYGLVVNIPLIEMDSENASPEVWLGTHNGNGVEAQVPNPDGKGSSGHIKEELHKEATAKRPSSKPLIKKGAIIIRDLRLWHRGMSNFTDKSRVLLTVFVFAPWYRNSMHVPISEDLKAVVEEDKSGFQLQTTYLPEEEIEKSYLDKSFEGWYTLDQEDRIGNGV